MAKKKAPQVDPEWPHYFDVAELGDGLHALTLSPDPEEAESLESRLDIEKLASLKADLKLQAQGQGRIHVEGQVKAVVLQNCVVSGDPVESEIDEAFEAWFADPEAAVSIEKARRDRDIKKGQSEVPILEEQDDPEPIIDGQIDLGELVTQYLSLAINPYPHAEGIEYEFGDDQQKEDAGAFRNPFAKLKDWKARQEKE